MAKFSALLVCVVFWISCSQQSDIDALTEVASETTLTDQQFDRLENEFLIASYESPRRAKPWQSKCLRILEIVSEFEVKIKNEKLKREEILELFLESKAALDSVYSFEKSDAQFGKPAYKFSISTDGVSEDVLPIYLLSKIKNHAFFQLNEMADHIRLYVFNDRYGIPSRYAQDEDGYHFIDLYGSPIKSPKRIIQVDSIFRNGKLEQFEYEISEGILGQINFAELPKGSYRLVGKVFYEADHTSFDSVVYHSAFEVK
jgi:hypothetical protein